MFRAVIGTHLSSVQASAVTLLQGLLRVSLFQVRPSLAAQSRQVHSLPGLTDGVVPEALSRALMCPNSSGSSVEQQALNLGAGH